MNLLDLDDKLSWEQTVFDFIKNDPLWDIIEKAISSESDDDIFKLQRKIHESNEKKYLELKDRCFDNCQRKYQYVAAYHSCRPVDKNTYLKRGIFPANTDKLIEDAIDLFQDRKAVESAIQEIKDENRVDYLDYGSGKIWFFISRTKAFSCSHYMEYGSELIKIIAGKIGDWAVQKLANLGIPVIFRCKIPIAWLNQSIARIYSNSALSQLLTLYLKDTNDLENVIHGAFCIEQYLPNDHIIEVLEVASH